MATIQGNQGSQLSSDLASYISKNSGNLSSEQLSVIINQYLTEGDKLGSVGGSVNSGIYKRFGQFDQVTGKVEVVTSGIWSGDTGSLSTFFEDTSQSTHKYFTNVYDVDFSSDPTAEIQFAVAYGNKNGGGCEDLSTNDNATLATKATYSQYRSILLDQDDSSFSFKSGSIDAGYDSDDIYVINLSRSRYRESMDAGNFSLTVSGSNGEFTFIDDSGQKFSESYGTAGSVFNVVIGTLNLGTSNEATITSTVDSAGRGFGLFYPHQGLLILNPIALETHVGIDAAIVTTDVESYNQDKLISAISLGSDFEARRTENISTAHYFVRATNREYNFSNNPSWVTGSNGVFSQPTFERDPKTYITTVGLYNDASEMLAVAKTSQPIPKSFDKELLLKIKLEF